MIGSLGNAKKTAPHVLGHDGSVVFTAGQLVERWKAAGTRLHDPLPVFLGSAGSCQVHWPHDEQMDNFTGERWEAYAELLFLRARYYEPGMGRFLNPDTVTPNFARPSTLNLFLYVDNNPLSYFDPSGHQPACLDSPGSCPSPPPGKVWVYLGHWGVSVYGHADHEKWASGSTDDQATVSWKEDGQEESASVNLKWLRNVLWQGTAGRLTIQDTHGYREVWLKCQSERKPEDIMPGEKVDCLKKPEPPSLGAEGVRVACNPCPQIPTYDEFKGNTAWCRDDVKRGDTLCIAGWPNMVKLRGAGFGSWEGPQARKVQKRTEWLDMYIGLHGPNYDRIGFRNIWVLRPSPFPDTCYEWLPCPN